MKNTQEIDKKIPLIGVAIAGAISVTTSSGKFDMIDSIVGIVLIALLWPFLFDVKSTYMRSITALISGLTLLLIFGFMIEIYRASIFPDLKYEMLHFLFWLAFSIVSFLIIFCFEEKKQSE